MLLRGLFSSPSTMRMISRPGLIWPLLFFIFSLGLGDCTVKAGEARGGNGKQEAPAAPAEGDQAGKSAKKEKKKEKTGKEQSEAKKKAAVPVTEVVVTATRTKEAVRDLPLSVSVLTQEAIQRRQARTPNQMLREEVGIFTPEVADQGSPIIRGFIGNRVLYLWDGIRINNGALFGGPNGFFNQFPVGAIDKMEVIRGPGAVQYGSDAMGGVINIISKKLGSFPDDPEYGGETYTRYRTVDNSNTEHLDVRIASKRVNFIGGFSHQDIGDFRGPGEGVIKNNGVKNLGGYVNLAFRPLDDQTLRVTWIHNRRDDVETYTQSKRNASGVPRFFGPYEERGLVKLDYQVDHLTPWSSNLETYGYWQYHDFTRDTNTQSGGGSGTTLNRIRREQNQDIYGGGIQNTTPLGPHSFTYGVDYRYESLRNHQNLFSKDLTTGAITSSRTFDKAPDGTYDVFDAFAIGNFNPIASLHVTAGVRFESTHLASDPNFFDVLAPLTIDDLDIDERWNSFTWSLGTVYDISPEWSLAANVATAFRAPTFSDTLSTGIPTFASGIASVPSPGVGPEKAITYEFGPRYHSDKIDFSLTGYWTQFDDFIGREVTGTIFIPGIGTVAARQKINSVEGYMAGIEVAGEFRFTREWTVFGNATFTRGQNGEIHAPFRRVPPLNGIIGLRYAHKSGKWWVEAVEVMVDRIRKVSPDDRRDSSFATDPGFGSPSGSNPPLRDNFKLPGYALTNLRGGVNVWKDSKRSFDITIDLDNVFNTRYREHFAQRQLVAPGFSAAIGGRLKW